MRPVVDRFEEERGVEPLPQGSPVVIGEAHDHGVDRAAMNGIAKFLRCHLAVPISVGDQSHWHIQHIGTSGSASAQKPVGLAQGGVAQTCSAVTAGWWHATQ